MLIFFLPQLFSGKALNCFSCVRSYDLKAISLADLDQDWNGPGVGDFLKGLDDRTSHHPEIIPLQSGQ
jgi:hypothetical protein